MTASPCIEVCRMHDTAGLCVGCRRTLDEIARWSVMSEAEKAQVVAQLAARRISAAA